MMAVLPHATVSFVKTDYDGPTIEMTCNDNRGPLELRRAVQEVLDGGGPVRVQELPGFEFSNVAGIEMWLTDRESGLRFWKPKKQEVYNWVCARETWQQVADLLDPLTTTAHGFQYLNGDAPGDAVIKMMVGGAS